MKNIKAVLLLAIIVLALFGILIWFGIEFKSRGDALRQAQGAEKRMKHSKDSLQTVLDFARAGLRQAQADGVRDSLNYSKTILLTQKSCSDVKTDRDYWKDYAEKVESGKWCPEMYGWMKKKKRLVPCKPPRATLDPP